VIEFKRPLLIHNFSCPRDAFPEGIMPPSLLRLAFSVKMPSRNPYPGAENSIFLLDLISARNWCSN